MSMLIDWLAPVYRRPNDDWDEYTPFEEWRGGSAGPNGGTIQPNPVVSCRVCGHEEPEGSFYALRSDSDESEDEATRAARIACDTK